MLVKGIESLEELKMIMEGNSNKVSRDTIDVITNAYAYNCLGIGNPVSTTDVLAKESAKTYSAGRVSQLVPEHVCADSCVVSSGSEYRYIWDRYDLTQNQLYQVIILSKVGVSGLLVYKMPVITADSEDKYNTMCSIVASMLAEIMEVSNK